MFDPRHLNAETKVVGMAYDQLADHLSLGASNLVSQVAYVEGSLRDEGIVGNKRVRLVIDQVLRDGRDVTNLLNSVRTVEDMFPTSKPHDENEEEMYEPKAA